MLKRLQKFWSNYKHRSVLWVSLQMHLSGRKELLQRLNTNIKEAPNGDNNIIDHQNCSPKDVKLNNSKKSTSTKVHVHHVSAGEEITNEQLTTVLQSLFQEFVFPSSEHCSPVERQDVVRKNGEIMEQILGFRIEKDKSTLGPTAGNGVFVRNGSVKAGSLVALYPGTIYMPSEPLFFASIKNQFIFRGKTGILIDGNDRGLSKTIYTSCAKRDQFGLEIPCCDLSWISSNDQLINPLNMGQYVNNRSGSVPHNVVYQECSLSYETMDVHLWRFLPNVWYNPENNDVGLKLVPLVAVRDIDEGEEVFSSYFTFVHE